MAKTKRKQLAAIAAMKESQAVEQGRFSETSLLDDKEPWIEVRKQKVIILIPPLPKAQEGPKRGKNLWKAKLSEVAIHDCIGKDFVAKPSRRADQKKVNKILSKANKLGDFRRRKVTNAHVSLEKAPNDTEKVSGNEPNVSVLKNRLETMPTVDGRQIRSKRKWKDGKNSLNTASRRRKSVAHTSKENCAVAPPLSGMDVLLASVETINSKQIVQDGNGELGSSHREVANISDTGKKALYQHTESPEILIANTQENISIDTADSSIPPCASSALQGDMKVSLHDKKASEKHASEILPERFEMLRKEENVLTSERLLLNTPVRLLDKKVEKDIVMVEVAKLSNDVHEKLPSSGSRHGDEDFLYGRCHVYPILSANQSLKVLTLKKQLEKAGGLRKWLFSVGLERFVEVFEKRMFNEVELLLLNMDDVKKMGIAAVGPRRKLIWAINHLSQQLM